MSRVQAPRWARRALTLVAAMALVLAIPLSALGSDGPQRVEPDGPSFDVDDRDVTPEFSSQLWFVEFEGEPTARGGNASAMARERNALRREARAAGIQFEERFDYQRLWNGMSVRASASEAHALAKMSNAAAVYPVELIDAPEPQSDEEPQLGTALGLTGADVAQSELGYDGAGLSVAVIDTGIDYQHPDLGGDGEGTSFPTDRVTHGFDYVGDDYNAADPDNDEPQPNPDPMDVNGHGTHVAGIVGANGEVIGAAPGVTLGAYKVFGTSGSSSADVIIAAMEDAHDDGMDVINMSLGAAYAWGEYPTSQVANQLVADGTVVVASAGNSGRTGVFSLGAPGNASDVIGVASADNLSMSAMVMEIEGLGVDENDDLPYTGISSAELPPKEGESDPIVWIGRACESLGDDLEGDPDGATALIVRGDCTFEEKYDVAVEAGATGVIIHNNIPGLFAGGGIVPVEGIWAAATTADHGEALRALLDEAEDEVTATFTDRTMLVANPTGGLISDFSSYGMTPDLQFRPDITAPGGLIESTYPLASGGYATISGTSMSAPHVAGAVALLLEARPDLASDEVRGVLQNSAVPFDWALAPGAGLLEPAFRQGAGMMQIDRAITATTAVSPSKVELGQDEVTEVTLSITNAGDAAVTYLLSHVGTIGTGGFGDDPWGDWATIFYPQFAGPTTSVEFAEDSVTVEAGQTVEVDATIINPDFGLYAHQASGYILLDSTTDRKVVPFAGLAGQLSDIEIWPEDRPANTGMENHLVAQEVEGDDGDPELVAVEPGHVFDREAGEEPIAAVFMGFAAQRVEVTARHVDTGHEVDVAEVDFARRSASEVEYLTYSWDGREQVGNSPARRPAPRGEWVFEVRALPVGEDAGDDEAWLEETTYSFEFQDGPPPGRGGPPPGRGGPPGDRGPR